MVHPTPDRKGRPAFLMPVEDVFTITGRGTVATGRVERGQLRTTEEVEIVGLTEGAERLSSPVLRCSARFSITLRPAITSAPCCAACREMRSSAARFCAKPAPFIPHQVQGPGVRSDQGRGAAVIPPFFNNYRPQFFFRTTDVTGVISPARGHRDVHAWRQRRDGRELITPSPSRKASASLSAKAAVPLVLVLSPRSMPNFFQS